MVKPTVTLLSMLALVLAVGSASADEAPPVTSPRAPDVRVHHAPVASATAGDSLAIDATIDHPELVRYLGLVYRTQVGKWSSVPFLRSQAGESYVAVIPAEEVRGASLGYTIEVVRTDGTAQTAFAGRAAPHEVELVEPHLDARERALLERLHGRRSVASMGSEAVRFGTTSGPSLIPCDKGQSSCTQGQMVRPEVDDQYWRVELAYTYRPLRTIAEFSIRGGVVRGTSLVPTKTLDQEKYKVGLNYGAPTVRFRLSDRWHLEAEVLTSITEVGFSVGAGGALLIGDPYGTKLTLGSETIGIERSTYFGSRFYSKVDIVASSRLTLAPSVEVTDMPHADAYGVRLIGDATVDLGYGFFLGLRGGYQARKSTSGGPTFGGNLALAF